MLLISASATHFNSCFLSPFLVSYPIAWISLSLTKRNLHIKKTNNSFFLKLYTDMHTPINIQLEMTNTWRHTHVLFIAMKSQGHVFVSVVNATSLDEESRPWRRSQNVKSVVHGYTHWLERIGCFTVCCLAACLYQCACVCTYIHVTFIYVIQESH